MQTAEYASIRTEAIVVRYTDDQVAALCQLFDRPDLLAAFDGADGPDIEVDGDAGSRQVALAAAARTLVSSWIVTYDDHDGWERDADATADEAAADDMTSAGQPTVRLLEPHTQVLGTLWRATGLVAVTRETDVAEELLVVVGDDGTVVERARVLPGVHEFTLTASAEFPSRVLDFLDVDPEQPAPSGEGFECTPQDLTRLERFAGGAIPEAAADMVPDAGFVAAVTTPISHGAITVLRQAGDGFEGEHLSWVRGDDGMWCIEAPDTGTEGVVRVRPASGAYLSALITAVIP